MCRQCLASACSCSYHVGSCVLLTRCLYCGVFTLSLEQPRPSLPQTLVHGAVQASQRSNPNYSENECCPKYDIINNEFRSICSYRLAGPTPNPAVGIRSDDITYQHGQRKSR